MNTKNKAIVTSLVSLMLLAAMVGAVSARTNTIASSTMIFRGGNMSYDGDGTYSGIAPMIDEAALNIGDDESGFDVYAKNGAMATYDKAGSGGQDYACGAVTTHDAYTTTGGWGVTYDPDCGDWYNYQLRFDDTKWYLEYNGDVGSDNILSGASAPTMSGTMDWTNMYAAETDAGAYYAGMGTAESAGYALDNLCTCTNDGSASWDMDWSWGSEFVPLEFPGFTVTITNIGSYEVILTPAVETGVGSKASVNNVAPHVCAKWEACPDDENDPQTEFTPNLWPAKKDIAIVACVCDGNGNDDIKNVKATVTGPGGAPIYNVVLSADDTVDCDGKTCDYGTVPCTGYSGTLQLAACDPAGTYTVVVKAKDNSNVESAPEENEFEYLSIIAPDLDFTTVNYGGVTIDVESYVFGDNSMAASGQSIYPTIHNLGNDNMEISIEVTKMTGAGGSFDMRLDAKVPGTGASSHGTDLPPDTEVLFPYDFECCTPEPIDFSIKPPAGTKGAYTGTITITAYHAA